MKKLGVEITREALAYTASMVFDAPCALVWKIYTDPALVHRWWGPARHQIVVDKMDVRVGGEWRFLMKHKDGQDLGFSGVYKEVLAPHKLVHTFVFEPDPSAVSLESLTFEAMPDGRTKFVSRSSVDSEKNLGAIVSDGMEGGALETFERLAELIRTEMTKISG